MSNLLGGPPFKDRHDAGRQLAEALPALDPASTVVIALPRGGVPVAEEICKARHLPLDLVFVHKIGAPLQPEVAVGAIVDGAQPKVIVNHNVAERIGLSEKTVISMGQDLLPEIERRKTRYFGGSERPVLSGKTLVVVDDGVATGATLKAGLEALRESGAARTVLALPTAPSEVLNGLARLVEAVICLDSPARFVAVGAAYRDFPQTSDDEVAQAIQRCASYTVEMGDN